ncbi:MAG: hypothetical protein WCQ49_03415 [Candidatus Saccharibacteria bacterium]
MNRMASFSQIFSERLSINITASARSSGSVNLSEKTSPAFLNISVCVPA